MIDKRKLATRLAYLKAHDHLSPFGLEMIMDCFGTTEIQEMGAQFARANNLISEVQQRVRNKRHTEGW